MTTDQKHQPATDITARPDCHACEGTGIDIAFGGKCSECEHDASLARQRFNAPTDRSDRIHTPGERMDGRTFGGSTGTNRATDKQIAFMTRLVSERSGNSESVVTAARAMLDSSMPIRKDEASHVIDALLKVAPVSETGKSQNTASDKQLAFMSLLSDRDRTDERHRAECETIEMLIAEGQMTRQAASPTIDLLKSIPKARPVVVDDAPVVGLDLRPLERYTSNGIVRMAIPGTTNESGNRLKVSIRFRRNGNIYVDDAAEYGYGKNYGSQKAGAAYRGSIESELQAMLDDPHGAVVAYAAITSRCGVCNAKLEDKSSVERGMGPVCAVKFG